MDIIPAWVRYLVSVAMVVELKMCLLEAKQFDLADKIGLMLTRMEGNDPVIQEECHRFVTVLQPKNI